MLQFIDICLMTIGFFSTLALLISLQELDKCEDYALVKTNWRVSVKKVSDTGDIKEKSVSRNLNSVHLAKTVFCVSLIVLVMLFLCYRTFNTLPREATTREIAYNNATVASSSITLEDILTKLKDGEHVRLHYEDHNNYTYKSLDSKALSNMENDFDVSLQDVDKVSLEEVTYTVTILGKKMSCGSHFTTYTLVVPNNINE